MASPTGKKGLDKNLLIGLGAIILIALSIFLLRSCSREECPAKIEFTFSGDLLAGTEVQFDDLTDGAKEWDWDFGDQSHAYTRNPTHKFEKEGVYRIVLHVNGRCEGLKEISIQPAAAVIVIDTPTLPVATIIGPTECTVGESVHFRDASSIATSWEWMFNETGVVDATTRDVYYTYKSPGSYTVVLIINGKSEQVQHKIKVKPPKKEKTNGGGGAPPAKKVMDSGFFILTMKKIALRQEKFSVFEPFFCGDKSVKITLPDKSSKSLMVFCSEVFRDEKFSGSSASFVTDPETGCITSVKLNQ